MMLSILQGWWSFALRKGLIRLSFLPAVLMGSGCTSLHLNQAYLHNDAAQQATESAQSGWQASDPTKLLDGQKDFFAKLAADEAATVRSSIIARRDLQLISLIRGDVGTVPF